MRLPALRRPAASPSTPDRRRDSRNSGCGTSRTSSGPRGPARTPAAAHMAEQDSIGRGDPWQTRSARARTRRGAVPPRRRRGRPEPIDPEPAQSGAHFDRVLGRSPSDYPLSVRLNQAEILLRMTARTVAGVAAATGFCGTSHLTHTLKKHRGGTPVERRRSPSAPMGEPLVRASDVRFLRCRTREQTCSFPPCFAVRSSPAGVDPWRSWQDPQDAFQSRR